MTTLEWIALGILVGVWLMPWVLWALTSKAEELVRLIRCLPENLVEAWEEQRRRRRNHAELRRKADRTGSLTKRNGISSSHTTAKSSPVMPARASQCRGMNG